MSELTKYEQETIINFNRDEETASIYSRDPVWIRKLTELAKKDKRVSLESKDEWSKTYIIPKTAIKVRMSRILSSEKRKELSLQAKRNFKN